jgi:hypothetical protein
MHEEERSSVTFPLRLAGNQNSVDEKQRNRQKYLGLVLAASILNLLSAVLFIARVNRPVYDDGYNIVDVHNYATNGLSVAAIRAQRNTPGPGSFLWMAGAVRLLGGDELRDARLGALASWVLLIGGVLVAARYSSFPNFWHGALLTLLVFPHAAEATSTVLTEGPALFFAVLGALACTEFVSRRSGAPNTLVLGMTAGLSIGLSIICRQYNLALLAAGALLIAREFVRGEANSPKKVYWRASAILSLAVAVVPVLLLVMVWRGLSSPGMASGTSYANWKAGVGVSFSRPIIAAFYLGVYLLPLTFPLMARVDAAWRKRFLLAAVLGGVIALYLRAFLLQPGPLNTFVGFASRVPALGIVAFGLVAVAAIYNGLAVGQRLWGQRASMAASPPTVLALLTILFFVGEQIGVGGNIPLYDRYLLQMAPFLGIIAFWLVPRVTYLRVFALMVLSLISQVMLWRYA